MIESPIRISMLVARFPPCVGGTERQAFLLARELVRLGVDVHVLTQQYLSTLPRKEVLEGISVERLPPAGGSRLASLLYLMRGLQILKDRYPPPDILHAHMIAAPALLARFAGPIVGSKTLVKVACSGPYGDVATSRETGIGRFKLNTVLQGLDRIVCLTPEIEREVREAGAAPLKLVRIPNGVDTEQFRPAASDEEKQHLRKQLGLNEGPLILFAGRFTEQKRPLQLLEAFLRAANEIPQAHVLFLGEGPLKDRLQKKIEESHLGDRVRLHSAHDQLELYYRCAEMFVLPSAGEGVSNSLLEAMASGLPCIVTDIGGKGLVDDRRNGLHVRLDQPDSLANAIQDVLHHPEYGRTLGSSARRTITESYRMQTIARHYIDLYRQLLRI